MPERDPNTTQAFLMDSASDLVQVTNPVIIILQGDFFLCALMFKSSSEQTVILQCLPGPGFFCFFFFKCNQSRVNLLGRCNWDSLTCCPVWKVLLGFKQPGYIEMIYFRSGEMSRCWGIRDLMR